MGHTQSKALKDLEGELAIIRTLPGLKEKSPGIFYFKSTPFLHFHDKDGDRWADVKIQNKWAKIGIAFDPSKSARTQFLKKVRAAHTEISKGKI
jgi:hypothetical protein